jgi:ankyrin repeat protein
MEILKTDIDTTNDLIKGTVFETYATTNVGADYDTVKMDLDEATVYNLLSGFNSVDVIKKTIVDKNAMIVIYMIQFYRLTGEQVKISKNNKYKYLYYKEIIPKTNDFDYTLCIDDILNGHILSNISDKSNVTALIYACKNKMTEVALKLLDMNCKPEQVNKHGNTALILACYKGKGMKEVALKLLDMNCNPEQVNKHGNTASILACEKGMKEVVLKLLDMNCNSEQVNKNGNTALIYACSKGMTEVALKLLDMNCKPEHVNKNRDTALILACDKGMTEVANKIKQKLKSLH